MSKVQTIKVRQSKQKQMLLDQLRRLPIREVAYEKVGLSLMTVARWRKASKKFADEMDAAMVTGREFICDLAESQVISLIRQGNYAAARLFLQYNDPRYANKLEASSTVNIKEAPMTATEKTLLRKAFKHSSLYGQRQKPKEK